MGAPRAWTTISGQTVAGRALSIVGQEALRTVYFDPSFARIELDTTSTPPRVVVYASATVATLQADVAALTARVQALEDIILDRIVRTNTGLQFIDSTAAIAIQYGRTDGDVQGIGYFTTSIMPRPTVSEASPTLDIDIATALNNNGSIRKTA